MISISPIAEVRGSIPLAFVFFSGHEALRAVVICVIGNLLIAPIAMLILNSVDRIIKNSRYVPTRLRNLYIRILNSARSRGSRAVSNYGLIGLSIFVAIPLPGTGAWTGSLVAYLLGMDKAKALIAIEVGVLIASLIILTATYLGIEVVKHIFMIPGATLTLA